MPSTMSRHFNNDCHQNNTDEGGGNSRRPDGNDENDHSPPGHLLGLGLTQAEDCVEWDESRNNLDLRKVASPGFQTPGGNGGPDDDGLLGGLSPMSAAAAAAITTTGTTANIAITTTARRRNDAGNHNNNNNNKARRRKSLDGVTKCLETTASARATSSDQHERQQQDTEQEIDRILRRLAQEEGEEAVSAANHHDVNLSTEPTQKQKNGRSASSSSSWNNKVDASSSWKSSGSSRRRMDEENVAVHANSSSNNNNTMMVGGRKRRRRENSLRIRREKQQQLLLQRQRRSQATNSQTRNHNGSGNSDATNGNDPKNNNKNNGQEDNDTTVTPPPPSNNNNDDNDGGSKDFQELLKHLQTPSPVPAPAPPLPGSNKRSESSGVKNSSSSSSLLRHRPSILQPIIPSTNEITPKTAAATFRPNSKRRFSVPPPPTANSTATSNTTSCARNPKFPVPAALPPAKSPLPRIVDQQMDNKNSSNNKKESRKLMVEGGEDDEFGDLPIISMDDIALMDTMVMKATQQSSLSQRNNQSTTAVQPKHPHHQEDSLLQARRKPLPQPTTSSMSSSNQTLAAATTTATAADSATAVSKASPTNKDSVVAANSKAALPAQQQRSTAISAKATAVIAATVEEDPFGDFPELDFDFEALDKTIAERQQKSQAHTQISASQPSPGFSTADLHRDLRILANAQEGGKDQARDIPPPNAIVSNLKSPRITSQLQTKGVDYLRFTRYKVLAVREDVPSFTKTLSVAEWTSSMVEDDVDETSKAIHRRDLLGRLHSTPKKTASLKMDGDVHLRGEWYHTPIADGDTIHICSITGEFETNRTALPLILHTCPPQGSNNDDLVLVVHPDMLVIPTTISETVSCTRRAVLKTRLGSTGLSSKATLFGTMRHDLLEETMRGMDFSPNTARKFVQQIVRKRAEGLLSCGVTSAEAKQELIKFLPQIIRFADKFTEFSGKPKQIRELSDLESHGNQPTIKFVATAVEGIEEPVISPELGLKGFVDMVVQAKTSQSMKINPWSQQQSVKSPPILMGVELKTGHNQRTQNAHMAQLALYTLMLRAKFGSKTDGNENVLGATASGLLLYMNSEDIRAVHVAPHLNEIKSLIGQRNMVAIETRRVARPRGITMSYESERDCSNEDPNVDLLDPPPPVALPDVLPNSFSCKKCYSNKECMLYAATANLSLQPNDMDLVGKSHKDLLQQFAGHLSREDFAYFSKWDRLVDLEAHAESFLPAKTWLVPSDEREKETAKSITSLEFDDSSCSSQACSDGTSFALLSFRRCTSSSIQTPLSSLGFEPGCNVIVSTDSTTIKQVALSPTVAPTCRPQMHLVRGILHNTTQTHVFIHASVNDLDRIRRVIRKNDNNIDLPTNKVRRLKLLFRADKDDAAFGVGTLRQNLVNLFSAGADTEESNRTRRLSSLRDVIVRNRTPRFHDDVAQSLFSTNSTVMLPGCDMYDLVAEYAELNSDQKAAVQKVLGAEDYSLIQGLPGTGKTSTITFLARLLAAHGKRVLITSYTNSAVDNVLLKLLEKGLGMTGQARSLSAVVRVGRKSSCHPGVYPILAPNVAARLEAGDGMAENTNADHMQPSAESLLKSVSSARIVGVTALAVPRSPLLVGQNFDVVIVDEAGQINQPVIIGALMSADSFVLVGDHMQLPPLVNSELAEKGGFGVSMLKHLAEKQPDAVVQLTYQYRMNEEICRLSNMMVYKDKLKCGNDDVRSRRLELSDFPKRLPPLNRNSYPWLMKVAHPNAPVVFVNTDGMKDATLKGSLTKENFQPLERKTGRHSSGGIVNSTEAALVNQIVHCVMACGIDPSLIGVICPFTAQLRILDEYPSLSKWKREDGLEISTIDRYQGRDKPVIVLSFVRSNLKGRVGRLLSDFRRLNVAITRAKCKLIMIGSFKTLHTGSTVLKPILDRLKADGSIVQLPANALECYSM